MGQGLESSFLRGVRASAAAYGENEIRFTESSSSSEPMTFSQLDAFARASAVDLRLRHGLAPRDAVVLAFEPGMPFIRALMTTLYAGLVAVPAPITTMRNTDAVRDRLLAIASDAQARAILTAPGALDALGLTAESAPIPLITLDRVPRAMPEEWIEPAISDDDLAILQYTSGSTGTPKGVMVSHGNLDANQRAIAAMTGMDGDSVLVGWLPHYHDMGLIGQLLQPIYRGAAAILTSPTQFLRRPVTWLRMITEHRATHTVGPDFAFDQCTRVVTDEQRALLDLSSLEAVITGAEPVRATTLDAFTARFSPVGFRGEAFLPAFGMAETTLLVTGHRGTTPVEPFLASAAELERDRVVAASSRERHVALVPCGPPAPGFTVVIVDPITSSAVSPGEVGEVWVSGPSVAQGYWRRPDATAEVFGATLAGDPTNRFLRTGDLGCLIGGELVITGRLKDLIIMRGRNIYPQDIESAAGAILTSSGVSAAFELEPGESVGVVVEIDTARTPAEALPALLTDLRARLSAEFILPTLGVALVRRGGLPRTTSGKVQRSLTRRMLLEHALPVVAAQGLVDLDVLENA